MPLDFAQIAGVVCDMDGVLWLGDEPLPGLDTFFDLLHQNAVPYVLATNNSSKTPEDYVAKLTMMGIKGVSAQNIITSGTVTQSYLMERYPAGTPINMIGGAGLRKMLESAGYRLVDQGAHVVVVGLDAGLTYEKLKNSALCIRAGADFIATNVDPSIPIPDGFAPGAGSIVAALITTTDRQPTVIGKPHSPMFESALAHIGTTPAQTLMIGDRLDTDIAGAVSIGIQTALLLTGVTDDQRLESNDIQPDVVFRDLAHLVDVWVTQLG